MAPISQESTSNLGLGSIKQHEEYYLRDGNICFLVEKTVFRLHRYFFERESDYFREWLKSNLDEDGSPGSPYIVHDIKSSEFAQFVWVWYNPRYSFSEQDKQKWLTILRLATQWRFNEIRSLAVRQLEKLQLEPIEKITTYKQYSVDKKLLLPSYISLCRRKELPSPEEGKMLTMDTVLKLASAREQAIITASERGCKTPATANVPIDIFEEVVAELFELTLHSNEQTVGVGGQALNNGDAKSGEKPVDTEVITVKQPGRKKKGKQDQDVTQVSSGGNGWWCT